MLYLIITRLHIFVDYNIYYFLLIRQVTINWSWTMIADKMKLRTYVCSISHFILNNVSNLKCLHQEYQSAFYTFCMSRKIKSWPTDQQFSISIQFLYVQTNCQDFHKGGTLINSWCDMVVGLLYSDFNSHTFIL